MFRIRYLLVAFAALGLGGAAATVHAARFGPDQFGYVWVDSDEEDGPAFNWVDISGDGVALGGGDDVVYGPIDLGISFPFYGERYSNVYICTNGYLSFTSSAVSLFCPGIPNVQLPNAVVAPLWRDLYLEQDQLRFLADSLNNRCIIQWEMGLPSDPMSRAQVVLSAEGDILFQYSPTLSCADNCAVGIENAEGTVGIQGGWRDPDRARALAIRISLRPPVSHLTMICEGNDIVLRWIPTGARTYHIYGSTDGIHFTDPPIEISDPPCILINETLNWPQRFYLVRAVY